MSQISGRKKLFIKFNLFEKFSLFENFKHLNELNVLCEPNESQLVSINSIKTIESFTQSMVCDNKSAVIKPMVELLSIVLFTSETNSSLNKMCLKLLQQNYKTEDLVVFEVLTTLLKENEGSYSQNIDNIHTVFNGFRVSPKFDFESVLKYLTNVFTHLKINFHYKLMEKTIQIDSHEVNFFCDLYHSFLKSLYVLVQKIKTIDKQVMNKLLKTKLFLSLIDSIENQVFSAQVIPIGCVISGSLVLSLVQSLNGQTFNDFVDYVNKRQIFDERSRLALISSSFITYSSSQLKDNQMFNDLEVLKSFVKNKNQKESQFLVLHSNLFLNWTQVMIKIMKDSNEKQKPMIYSNRIQIIDYFCDEMIEFVENHFNSSIDQIDRILRNVFLLKQCLLSTEDLRQYFRRIISELDCKSKNPLNKYRFLTHIYQSIGPKDFIQVFGQMIHKLFDEIKVLFEEKNDGINEIFHLISVIISLPDQKIIDQLKDDLCLWIKSEEGSHGFSRTNLLFGTVLPKLTKKHSIFVKSVCLKLLDDQKDLNCKQMVSIIKVIKSIDETLLDSNHYNEWLNKSLSHFEVDIRLDSLSLIIESRKTTQVLTKSDLKLIFDSIDCNMNCQQSSSRQRFVALIQKLIQRVINSLNFSQTSKKSTYDELRSDYNQFIEHLMILCFENLRKTQFFGTTSAKLQILEIINNLILQNKTHFSFYQKIDFNKYFHNLLDVISDSFEENKSLSLKIIINCFKEKLLTISEEQIQEIKRIANNLSESSTPGHSITAAYLHKLIVNIEISENKSKNDLVYESIAKLCADIDLFLEWAQKDVVISAAKYPLYTKLSSIRSVLNEVDFPSISVENIVLWKQLIEKVIDLCYQCSNSVVYIVCNDSPEGHLPMDCNLVTPELIGKLLNLSIEHISKEKVSHITSQMLLLNGWKTIKESAWLLAELCRTANQMNFHNLRDIPIIDCNQIIAIIDFLYSNLMSLKHRGAFEQTASAFTLLIANVWTNKCFCSTKVAQLLEDIIYNLENENESEVKGCVTRRSAGLPFVIQAILSGEPTLHNNNYFNQTMVRLLNILSNDCSKEWQIIHGLNIIRALIKDRRMSDKVNPFVEQSVEICFIKFKSNSFAIRNCSAMLCNCLMTKIFGVKRNKEDNSKKNRMSSKLFFTTYPSLYDFLLKEISICSQFETLEDNCPTNILHIESLPLYPLLILLSKLMPSINTTTVHNMDVFLPYLKAICLKCRHFKLRVLSAKVFSQLIQESDIEDSLSGFCQQLIDSINVSQNEFHGISLLLKHLFLTVKSPQKNIVVKYEQTLETILSPIYRRISYYSLTPFIQIIEILCERKLLTIDQKYKISNYLLFKINCEKLNSFYKTDEYIVYLSRSLIRCLSSLDMQFKYFEKLFCCRNDKYFESKLINLKIIINSVLNDTKSCCDISGEMSYESVFPVPSFVLQNVKLLITDYNFIGLLIKTPEFSQFMETIRNFRQNNEMSAVSNAFVSEIFRLIFYSSTEYQIEIKSIFNEIQKHYSINFEFFQFLLKSFESIKDDDIESTILLTSASFMTQLSDEELTQYSTNGSLEKWCQIIVNFSCDENYIIHRKVVAKVLSVCFKTMVGMTQKSDCCVKLWEALIHLIQDNEVDIRRRAVEVVASLEDSKEPMASKIALGLAIKHFTEYFSSDPISCVYHLTNWIIESDEEVDCDSSGSDRLFDKSKLNIFADSLLLTDILLKQLKSILTNNSFNLNDLRLSTKQLMESFGLKQFETTNEEAINHLLIKFSEDNNIYGLEQQLLESDRNYNTFKQTICSKLIQTLIETTNNGLRSDQNI